MPTNLQTFAPDCVGRRTDRSVRLSGPIGAARIGSLLLAVAGCTQSGQPKPDVIPPAAADTDADGIPDSEDRCPERAEDCDGSDDEDGCPDVELTSFVSSKEICSVTANSQCISSARVCSSKPPDWLSSAPGHCVPQPADCVCRQEPPYGCSGLEEAAVEPEASCELTGPVCVLVFPKMLLEEENEGQWTHALDERGLAFESEGPTARVTATPTALGTIADNVRGSTVNGECALYVPGLRVVDDLAQLVGGFGACPP